MMRERGMRMRRIVLFFLMACLLLAGGCQPAAPVARDEDDRPRYTGTLCVALHSGYLNSEKPYRAGEKPYPIQDRMAAFMDLHPGVEIEVLDFGGIMRDLRRVLDDPEWAPDIVELSPIEARLTAAGKLASLAGYVDRAAARWEDGYLRMIDLAEIDGEPYLLPVTSDPVVAYYDRLTFRRAGVPEPTENWDWEEFTRKAAWLGGLGTPIGIPTDWNSVEPFIRGLGGIYLSDDGETASGYLDSDATAMAFSRYAEMMPVDLAIRNRPQNRSAPAIGLMRATGMYWPVRDEFGNFAPAPMPVAPSGERLNSSLMTGLAIMADSAQKDLAWELMAFIVGETGEEALRFVAANTLETSSMWYRSFPDERYETLKELMAREMVQSPPAPFNQQVTHPHAYPVLTLEELRAMADPAEGKVILGRAAGLLDAAMASMKAR